MQRLDRAHFFAGPTVPPGIWPDFVIGQTLAISGDTMVVAVQGDDTAAGSNAGSVRVFIRNGGTWTRQAALTPSGPAAGDRFGSSVAISGDTVAIGTTHDDIPPFNAGSFTIFTRSGTVWTLLDSQRDRVIVEDSPPPVAQRRFARVLVTVP